MTNTIEKEYNLEGRCFVIGSEPNVIGLKGYIGTFSPVISQLVAEMRTKEIRPYNFRKNAEKVGEYLAFEAEKTDGLKLSGVRVKTPLGFAEHEVRTEEPILLNVLRAADPMIHGVQEIYRNSNVVFADTARREGELDENNEMVVDLNYIKYSGVTSLDGKKLIIPDIMLATGSSICKIMERLVEQLGQPSSVDLYSIISAPPGILKVLTSIPNSRVFTAAIDPKLNKKGYIFPGLGDAGDKCYNGLNGNGDQIYLGMYKSIKFLR
ncbi:uracil phosphoribosyltransferase [Candidatus Woesearchaeota archaeon]|nr:uracil phosphoribosyltransferase [Candidatus Woesearchaeota archaeon]